MSTSYSIYRFAKPTKLELAKIDYFSECDSFPVYDADGDQTGECIRLFRSIDEGVANIRNSKFVRVLVLPEKVTDYERLVRMAIQNFLKNPVISMVLRLSDNKFSCF